MFYRILNNKYTINPLSVDYFIAFVDLLIYSMLHNFFKIHVLLPMIYVKIHAACLYMPHHLNTL